MIEIKRGVLLKKLFERENIKGFLVNINEKTEKCIVYESLVGNLNEGDEVLLNTTAVSLRLGTGGYHYVIASINIKNKDFSLGGHLMKLRYTPMQIKVLSVEEEESIHRETMLNADSLEKTPVLVGTLHSMLAPLAIYLHSLNIKTAFVMTDGAALPIDFSQTVDRLKEEGIITGSVTTGHSFGGDLEAVNIYSGMLAAKKVLNADVIIVAMGPGIVGTGTKWGFTGVEQGEILNAVETLEGIPIAVPRISFADKRERHQGISHHTLTVLARVCKVETLVPLPELEKEKKDHIQQQIKNHNLEHKHQFFEYNGNKIINLLNDYGYNVTTMGRGINEDLEFFLTLGAAAQIAVDTLNNFEF
ncbi:hypothetical protein SYNTR_0389 [Candidatus Syntrophocurvum alkaliphilum]|uniref:DUF3866 domain-containing protein n=1 Tax=Candidatus Syntrophocurvum alkaliphilum TaxID=2293317 RepID=A0A6I6DDW9_9FIRM|nr:DUF3866 family protein [Candidatus Syntrophocurvum alkaliphilum]QGT98982.1 hypothetical protein SYNTR_0389 [Candidatus Syntrophocurvum alkaliphilum]